MPAKRSAMRKIKDLLRLKFEAKLSRERAAAATGISKGACAYRRKNVDQRKKLVGDAFLTPRRVLIPHAADQTCNALGMGGRPGRDLRRQNSFHPARCQRIVVSGRTTSRASVPPVEES